MSDDIVPWKVHPGHSCNRDYDSDNCYSCKALMPPVPKLRCDCTPDVFPDGSRGHQDKCEIYPWCPHEVGAYVCSMPCGCRCNGCQALAQGHAAK